ncbi:MAG: hypothetical protein N4A48_04035 [Tepidibacter sp.]|uniref:hypothetical protein n=1 Tax=Tepidibacter sp. TaxID=2529387 RepID=UPI0025E66855|nr:hypothetical protein [Tepidibacter sp.]MCT4507919.1 hypothetical protein [Tepidibacter sp.]
MNVYRESDKVVEKEVSSCICPVCGENGRLILRKGKHFRRWYCICPKEHNANIKKEIDDIFQIGDRIRIYESSFGKDAKIDYTSYKEGIVIEKELSIINYHLSMKVDIAVHQSKHINKKSWVYGSVIKGVQSDDNLIELLTPQMKMII